MYTRSIFLIAFACCTLSVYAQYTTDKVLGPKNQQLADSLKKSEYPYLFPIWGKKVVAKGFNIPKSAGLSAQYLYQQSDIIIENLAVGFNNGPKYPLDEIIRFNSAVATSNGVNVRPDLWILPFLNVYGIVAKAKTSTAIDAGVWLPDSSGWHEVTNFKTKANFNSTTLGFGLTPTVGIRGYFLILDMNFSWSDIDALAKPAFVSIFGPRFGKNIALKKPEQSIALWIGGFRVKIASETSGSLNAADLFPTAEWGTKVDEGYQKLQENQQKVDAWWNGLSSTAQKNPANIAKHEAANAALATYGRVLDGASQVVSNASNASVQYSLEKRQKSMWNFIVGSQYQINRSLMVRLEYGFLGARQQVIAGLQYRFNL
ncbi:MAG TPA: hypothetical protein VE933_08095 [Chitinophagaceae bacterium]|nr:hypothetical protein [Chitinophagaceae bacterium]